MTCEIRYRSEVLVQMPMNQRSVVLSDMPARIQPAVAYIASLRTTVSRRGQVSALNKIAATIIDTSEMDRHQRALVWRQVDWSSLNAPAARAIMARITGAPAYRNKIMCALRGVARMAWEAKTIDTDTFERIRAIRTEAGLRLAAGRHLPKEEIRRLLEVCSLERDRPAAGARDAALIALLAGTGLRRAEACTLQLTGLDLEAGSVRVIGKRNKERMSYLSPGAIEALRDWLDVRGYSPGPLFCRISRKGEIRPDHGLSTIAVNRILDRRAGLAGVVDVTPHDFRRTFIGEALDAGADISTVAAIVGHDDVRTTARYDRRGERAKQRVATLVTVPYVRLPS